MPTFLTDDKRFAEVEPEGGVALTEQQVRDLAAYHAAEARGRFASTPNPSQGSVYQFRVMLPPGSETLFRNELEAHLRGLVATFDKGEVTVSPKAAIHTTIELPAEIFEIVRRDADKFGVSPEERLRTMIWLSHRSRFSEPDGDRAAELDRMVAEQRGRR